MSEDKGTLSWLSLLAKVGEWLALPLAYLFFAGFLYQYYYFSALGVPTKLADIPVSFFPVYAFSVFMDNWVGVLVWITLVLLAALLASRQVSWGPVALLALLLVAFPGCWWIARERGYREALRLRNGYEGRRVSFVLSDESPDGTTNNGRQDYPAEFRKANDEGKLILVTETTRAYYVVWQIYPNPPEAELPRATLFIVPRSDIKLVEVKLDSVDNIRPRRQDER